MMEYEGHLGKKMLASIEAGQENKLDTILLVHNKWKITLLELNDQNYHFNKIDNQF